ncbi:MAG: SCO family protein [Proteobacteria bacterium]|nr:SCO family protein [Pseudomonadota bacterium]
MNPRIAGLAAILLCLATPLQAAVTNVGWDQHTGTLLPLQLHFRDESNHAVVLGKYFNRTPVVLVLTYFSCPELCPMVLQGVQESLRSTGLEPGRDYQLLAVSIDPRDTPAEARQKMAELLKFAPLRLATHFLTAPDNSAAVLAHVLGLRYAFDSEHGQFAHAAGFTVVNSHGRISQYLFGVRYPAGTVRTALIDAGRGRIDAYADQLLLLCYHFDPLLGRYSLAILTGFRVAGVLALLLGALGWWRLSHARRP